MDKSLVLLFTAIIACATSVVGATTNTPHPVILPPSSQQPETEDGTIIGNTNTLKSRIASILSPIMGNELTTVHSLERVDAERGGVWVDLSVAEDYDSKFHRSVDGGGGNRRDGSNLKQSFESMRIRLGNGCSSLLSSWPHHTRGERTSSDEQRNGQIMGEEKEEEHPMRTDEWLVKVRLSPLLLAGRKAREANLFPQSTLRHANNEEGSGEEILTHDNANMPSANNTGKRNQMMKFARNGYVMLMEDADHQIDSQNDINNHDSPTSENKHHTKTRMTRIGKWKLDTAGIPWDIPVKLSDQIKTHGTHQMYDKVSKLSSSNNENQKQLKPSQPHTISKWTVLHYHADMHLSKFQQQPRMIRGTVTRDRWNEFSVPLFFGGAKKFILGKNMFRPVIGTFSAEGIGVDTIDFSYKNRGFGLDTAVDPGGKSKKNIKPNM